MGPERCRRAERGAAWARLMWASVLLVAPSRLVALTATGPRVGSGSGDPAQAGAGEVATARVLGARHVVQATVELACGPCWRRTGVVVDVAHGVSMLAIAAASPRWRRAALSDASVAAAFAAFGIFGGT